MASAVVRARGSGVSARKQVSARVRVSEMQRARLLGAAVSVVDELGWSGAVTTNVCARARVSRRTFYDLFANREDCLLAVLDDAAVRVEAELEAAGVDGLGWRERVRMGLWVVLCFFDREPVLARVCVVQSARGGRQVLEWREGVIARLAGVVSEGRSEGPSRSREVPPLTAEVLVGGVLAILNTRLLGGSRGRLSDLLGELMGMIALPYLGSAAASRERSRPAPAAASRMVLDGALVAGEGLLRDLPMRFTYRTALVLEEVAEHPGVSNRVVAERAGISDQGQASKLLARLKQLGLLSNTGAGQARGERNAWELTPTGVRVTESIRAHTRRRERVA